jgi:hypothetical protein
MGYVVEMYDVLLEKVCVYVTEGLVCGRIGLGVLREEWDTWQRRIGCVPEKDVVMWYAEEKDRV